MMPNKRDIAALKQPGDTEGSAKLVFLAKCGVVGFDAENCPIQNIYFDQFFIDYFEKGKLRSADTFFDSRSIKGFRFSLVLSNQVNIFDLMIVPEGTGAQPIKIGTINLKDPSSHNLTVFEPQVSLYARGLPVRLLDSYKIGLIDTSIGIDLKGMFNDFSFFATKRKAILKLASNETGVSINFLVMHYHDIDRDSSLSTIEIAEFKLRP